MGYVLSGELFCMQTGLVLPGMHVIRSELHSVRSDQDLM